MTSWSAGYVSDISYGAGFYRELTPAHLNFMALSLGIVPGPASSYLELGSGQGFGLALMAAVEPGTRFHGVDFNPEHIVTSRRIVTGAGLGNVEFEEASFEEVAQRGTAGDVDRIALHGVLSWVSPAMQEAVAAILARRLAPGGLAYMSYNAMPGWASSMPMQHLVRALARRAPTGRSDARVVHALNAMQDLEKNGARYFKQNSNVGPRLEHASTLDRAYLAHEYLNESWRPLHFAEVVELLEPTKLSFLGSATLAENIDAVAVPDALLGTIVEADGDIVWRETLRDYAANKHFRKDVFARGLPVASPVHHDAVLDAASFVLATDPDAIAYKFDGPLGEIEGHRDVYEPLVRRLADAQVATFAELAALPALAEKKRGTVLQALCLLVHSRQILPVSTSDRAAANEPCRRFNRFVSAANEIGYAYSFLASPVAGSGIVASPSELLVLSAIQAGCTDDDTLARHVRGVLARRGERPMYEGTVIENEEEALDRIATQLGPLAASRVPVWRRLGIL